MCQPSTSDLSDAVEAKPGLWLPRRLERPVRSAAKLGAPNAEGLLRHELADVPADFVADSLARLGPQLFQSVYDCQPVPGSHGAARWWRPEPASGPPRAGLRPEALRPSHLFEVTFADCQPPHPSPTSPPQPSLLVPAHGLVWAAKCAALAQLAPAASANAASTSPTLAAAANAPAAPFPLSVTPLRLPSSRAWPFIHSWVYLGQPGQLGTHLMTFDAPVTPPSPPSSPLPAVAAASGAVGSLAFSPAIESDPEELEPFYPEAVANGFPSAAELDRLGHSRPLSPTDGEAFAPPRAAVLDRAALVNGIWRTMITLGIEDDELWGHMDGVWRALVGMLEAGRRPDQAD